MPCFICNRGKATAPKPFIEYTCADGGTVDLCADCAGGLFVEKNVRAKLERLAVEAKP